MLKKEKVICDLYDILIKIRYPEIADTNFNHFQNAILTESKRIDLLQWILQKSSYSVNDSSSKLKNNCSSDNLYKYYTQIGLRTDENIFLGKCDFDKQLEFLSLLTFFIKTTCVTDDKSLNSDTENNENSSKELNEANIPTELPSKITCREIPGTNFNKDSEEISKDLKSEYFMDTFALDKLCSNIKEGINTFNKQNDEVEDKKLILENFNSSFKNIVSLPNENSESNVLSNDSNLCTELLNVCSTFSTFDKILVNQCQGKQKPVLHESARSDKHLGKIIRNNLVLIEQAVNMTTLED